jgi:hypothetical protein
MSSNEFSVSNNGRAGAKTEGVVKQAQAFGRDVKDQASELAQSATEVVKTQAGNMADSAKEMASDVGSKLRTSMTEQKTVGADYVGNVANIIRRTAYEFDGEMPQAGHYIRKAAAQLDNVSQALRDKDLSEIVGNVQDFARKQPTAFLGAAVLVGFAAVRFLKSSTGNKSSAGNSAATRVSQATSQDAVPPAGM